MFEFFLTKKGFAKLEYYIQEDIVQDYLEPLDNYTPVDGWLSRLLGEASKNISSEQNDIKEFCYSLFPNISNLETPPPPYNKAVDFILKEELIQFKNKNP